MRKNKNCPKCKYPLTELEYYTACLNCGWNNLTFETTFKLRLSRKLLKDIHNAVKHNKKKYQSISTFMRASIIKELRGLNTSPKAMTEEHYHLLKKDIESRWLK